MNEETDMTTDNKPKSTLPPDVDTTRWSPTHDRFGRSIGPGDKASLTTRKQTIKGTLMISDRAFVTLDDGKKIAALVIVCDDGAQYVPNNKQLRKLLLASITSIP